jgi:hypothetical protein
VGIGALGGNAALQAVGGGVANAAAGVGLAATGQHMTGFDIALTIGAGVAGGLASAYSVKAVQRVQQQTTQQVRNGAAAAGPGPAAATQETPTPAAAPARAEPSHQVRSLGIRNEQEFQLHQRILREGGSTQEMIARYNAQVSALRAAPATPRLMGILKPGGKLIGEAGSSSSIRILPGGAAEAEALFGQLSTGGEVVKGTSYPGTLVRLPGSGTVGFRPVSTSGPPTIDVKVNGLGIREIKFLP